MLTWEELFYPRGIPEDKKDSLLEVRDAFAACAKVLSAKLPEGRYKSIVKTDLEKLAAIATKAFSHEEAR